MPIEALSIAQRITIVASALSIGVPQAASIGISQTVPIVAIEGVSISFSHRLRFSHSSWVSLCLSLGEKMLVRVT